ncbi:MAG: DUF5329 domain-containing protein [Syntrophaceae bacterium]|nr:DUF5329 domain-containing protein [Syntrophaceae bacterium]
MYKTLLIFVPIFLMSAVPMTAAEPDGRTTAEIRHLLVFISASACQFNRNGSWHGASEAAAHIENKYRYALKRDLIGKAEDFIEYAATKSTISGKHYLVRCGGTTEIASADWLTRELTAYRSTRGKEGSQ